MKTRNMLLLLGAGGLVAWYFSSKVTAAASAALALPGQAGEAIGNALYDWGHPSQPWESIFYSVKFPDGSTHMIPGSTVDSTGAFTYSGVDYKMQDDVNHFHYAVAV